MKFKRDLVENNSLLLTSNPKITIVFSMFLLVVLLIPISTVYALEEITMEGLYVTAEKRFEDKGYVYEHYLFVQEEDGIKQYKLDSQNIPGNFLEVSGNDVMITGSFTPKTTANIEIQYNEDIKVSEFTIANPETFQRSLQRPQPASMISETFLSKWNSDINGFHDVNYFTDRHYNLGTDSMASYWLNHSYGKFSWSGTAYDWKRVNTAFDPSVSGQDFAAAQAAITTFDPDVDYTNVDQIIFVWDFCVEFAFAYLVPIPFTTDEGPKDFLVVHTFDCGDGFPTGILFERGIGVQAHEIGHTFGWEHTQQLPDALGSPYNDEHSLLSGGLADGPPGLITYHKNDAGWIVATDIVTILDGEQQTITLDFANMDSGTENYLMAMVPFGASGHYYTVEARTDGPLDAIIGDTTGIWIYHYSPTGHPGAVEPTPPILLVLADGLTETPPFPYFDFDNAGLDSGESFSENDVTFEYLSDTPTSITIRITNNVPECSPPQNGNWVITENCILIDNSIIFGNVSVQGNTLLTISTGTTLSIPEGKNITIESESGVLINQGGTFRIISGEDLVIVSIPQGTSVPGCELTNECFIPHEVTITVGGEVTWSNDDSAAHTVTSGNPDDGPSGKFDSGLFSAGQIFSHTFEESGTFEYFCTVHPWMEGIVNVV